MRKGVHGQVLITSGLKGIIHPKMKIQSLSPYLPAYPRTGERSLNTKHSWSFTGKGVAVMPQTIVVNSDQVLNVRKTKQKQKQKPVKLQQYFVD